AISWSANSSISSRTITPDIWRDELNASRSPDSSSAPDASDAAVELRAQIRKCVHDLRNVLASQSSAIHLLGSGLPASALAPELAKQANQLQVAIDQLARLAETATGN